jgi:hypothetical protein
MVNYTGGHAYENYTQQAQTEADRFKHPIDARKQPTFVRNIHGGVLAPNHVEGLVGIR